jgi:hypothetical protein
VWLKNGRLPVPACLDATKTPLVETGIRKPGRACQQDSTSRFARHTHAPLDVTKGGGPQVPASDDQNATSPSARHGMAGHDVDRRALELRMSE